MTDLNRYMNDNRLYRTQLDEHWYIYRLHLQ